MNSVTVNRALIFTLLSSSCKSAAEKADLSTALSNAQVFFVGGSEPSEYAPDDAPSFNLVVRCSTDAAALYVNRKFIKAIRILADTIPAVEIWTDGPNYGAILSLENRKVLNSGKESFREYMVSTTLDRTERNTAPDVTHTKENSSLKSEFVQLKDLATIIQKTEDEILTIIELSNILVSVQKGKASAVSANDASLIASRCFKESLKKLQNRVDDNVAATEKMPGEEKQPPHSISSIEVESLRGETSPRNTRAEVATVPRKRTVNKKQEDINADKLTDEPNAIVCKPRLTTKDIKPTPQETYEIITSKIITPPRDVFVHYLKTGVTNSAKKFLDDVQKKYVKANPGKNPVGFMKGIKQCVNKEWEELQMKANSTLPEANAN